MVLKQGRLSQLSQRSSRTNALECSITEVAISPHQPNEAFAALMIRSNSCIEKYEK